MSHVDRRTVDAILHVMMEMEPQPSNAPGLAGSMDNGMAGHITISTPDVISPNSQSDDYCDEQDGYTEDELRITKKFVEMIGGAERARELVDKVADCEECLDIVDDEAEQESMMGSLIGRMADTMPQTPDLPTSLYNPMGAQGQF